MESSRTSRIVATVRGRAAVPFSWLIAMALALGMIAGLPAASHAADDIDVYVTFEGYNLGQGYYVEPLRVTVPAGRTAAQVTMSVLGAKGKDVSPDPGDPTSSGFYLQGISGFDTGSVSVPSYISTQPGFTLGTSNGDAYLGTPDYNGMSGWMYTIDNVAGDVGAGSYTLSDGDVLRWQFTLYGYGCDLGVPSGCWGGDPYFTMVDKSALIRAIADADPAVIAPSALAAARAVAVDPLADAAAVTAAIDGLTPPAAEAEWIELTTTAAGQFLAALQQVLVNDYGQTDGAYDYSVVELLRVTGPMNTADFTALRNPAYAGTHIRELDLAAATPPAMYALNGMTALTDVVLPPLASMATANLFKDDAALKNVTVGATTTSFGSTTMFNGATGLEQITFLNPSAPTTFNASTFNGSNNAVPGSRVVTARVPDRTSGGYQLTGFTQYFADVVDIAPNPPADSETRAALRAVIARAQGIEADDAYTEEKWTTLQDALTHAQSVKDDPASTAGAVNDARVALQRAMDTLLGLSFKVSKGAEVGLYRKGALHFAAFDTFDLTKVAALSDDDYDVYIPSEPLANGSNYNVTAVIPEQTDKVVQVFTVAAASANTSYTLDLTPLDERAETPQLIAGVGFGDPRNLYTNLDDTGVVNIAVGDTFDLDTFRTAQAQNDTVNNYFIEPVFDFDVAGNSITTAPVGSEGRRRLAITGAQPGVSVIKVTYGPLKYLAANGTAYDFNGIEEQNTGLVVVNVGGDAATFDTGIVVRGDLDTFYFDKANGSLPFSFTPAAGTTVRVHKPLNQAAWGSGWATYEADGDGKFTVDLTAGRNIIELTNNGETRYQVVRAKGVDVAIANITDPGESFTSGDDASITLSGIEGGIEKLAGIYNPAFAAGTKPKLTYTDGTTPIVSNEGGQYNSVTTTYTLTYPFTGAEEATLTGYLSIGGLGAEWPYHREIPVTGKPANLNAVAIGPYDIGALPPVHVYEDGRITTQEPAAPVDKTALQAVLDEAGALNVADYTAASWTALQDVVAAATLVEADDDATQVDVDDAEQAVRTAIVGLARKGVAPTAPSVSAGTKATRRAAAAWLADGLAANGDVFTYGSNTDWGLTIDSVLAMAGAGVAGNQIAATAEKILGSGEAYIGTSSNLATSWPYVAKTFLALDVAGLDTTAFPVDGGTRDLEADLRSAVNPDGSWTNSADAFKTSLGVLALARTEAGVPAAVVTKFAQMGCTDETNANYGAFGFMVGCSFVDADTTAMAIQALLAAGVSVTAPSVEHATEWLLDQEPADGFPSVWGPGNTNTSGLAAQALHAVGESAAATAAGNFIEGLALKCTTATDEGVTDPAVVTTLRDANGAIAYNADGWDTAMADGITSTNGDQWRRATAQAVLGLGAPSLGFITAAGAEANTPSRECTTPVDPDGVATTLTLSVGSIVYGRTGTVKVTVKPQTGTEVPTGKVSTKVGSTTVTGVLVGGAATLTLPVRSLLPGARTITVNYAGVDGKFAPTVASTTVQVAKAVPVVTIKNLKPKNKKVKWGKIVRFQIIVRAPGSAGVVPRGMVLVNVAGTKKVVTLNAKGTATVKVKVAKKTKPGMKAIRVKYHGNGYVAPANVVEVKLRVRR